MVFINVGYKEKILNKEIMVNFIKLLSPFAPHIAEELWEKMEMKSELTYSEWPTYDKSKLVEETIEYPVQINGKMRSKIVSNIDDDNDRIKEIVLNDPKTKEYIDGKKIIKFLVVPKKIVTVVVK